MSERIERTGWGFKWGQVEVTRIASTPKWGYLLELESVKQRVEIRVTPSGLIRVGKVVRKARIQPQKDGV